MHSHNYYWFYISIILSKLERINGIHSFTHSFAHLFYVLKLIEGLLYAKITGIPSKIIYVTVKEEKITTCYQNLLKITCKR